MAATDFIFGRQGCPVESLVPVKNTHATTAIAEGDTVTVDASNPMTPTQGAIGVVQGTTDDLVFGIAVEAIAAGAFGKVARVGIVRCTASGGITVGAVVQADASGKVKTQVGGKPQIGQAVSTSVNNNDPISVAIAIAKNA